jgi:hypothetical protein
VRFYATTGLLSVYLKLLTGDAMFAQLPLLEAVKKYHCDYLFQVRENQPKILAKMKVLFNDAEHQKPNDVLPRKKRGLQSLAACG